MKIRMTFLALLSFCLAATAGFAEEKGGGNQDRPWLGPKADLNNDGKIGVEEAQKAEEAWKQMHREKRQEIKQNADTNSDGALDSIEKEAMKEQWAEKKEEWKENRQEKREELKEQRQEWKVEHPKLDKDNNPPGPVGGQGTNWENRPGPQGGPGVGPNRGASMRIDHDNNPPGIKGGPGSNWENKPGPQGGPGTSPNKHAGGGQGGPQKKK